MKQYHCEEEQGDGEAISHCVEIASPLRGSQ